MIGSYSQETVCGAVGERRAARVKNKDESRRFLKKYTRLKYARGGLVVARDWTKTQPPPPLVSKPVVYGYLPSPPTPTPLLSLSLSLSLSRRRVDIPVSAPSKSRLLTHALSEYT